MTKGHMKILTFGFDNEILCEHSSLDDMKDRLSKSFNNLRRRRTTLNFAKFSCYYANSDRNRRAVTTMKGP
jgi:hypothetical protein